MRSTTRQRFGEVIETGATPQNWGEQLAFGLRVVLAASTVVATLLVLTQEPTRPEMRWFLAFLATSLFVLSIVESELIRLPGVVVGGSGSEGRNGASTEANQDVATAVSPDTSLRDFQQDSQVNIKQLAIHRTDYVSTLSHELRTPLTSIRGFAQLLARDNLIPGDSRVYASTIVQEADRLARIVDDVVALTKMESTLLELRRDPVSVADLLTRAVERLQPSEVTRKLNVVVPEQLPWIRGDEDRLRQVMERLLLDAISHTGPDTTITITAEAEGDAVSVCLKYPTTSSQLARMARTLEGLWQCEVDGTATRLGRGELGLYIAKNLIEAHGGHISIEGPGAGEVHVSIVLPC